MFLVTAFPPLAYRELLHCKSLIIIEREIKEREETLIIGGSAYDLPPHFKAFYWQHLCLIYLIVYKILFIEK
jgi:hypothetical protein